MAVCSFCLDRFAARSAHQTAVQQANIASAPDVSVAPCPSCSGTEWAVTDYMVKPEPPQPSLLRRVLARFGF
ncbi:hypothetical protein [Bradyrhizobium valentinum]|uniref:Uncharacterized protein n=1 Tax=Bradyrhizobium valentinum TaxID=1518501 RepID=A0A0R3KUW8_9BRAD|nr:hypothetical protein [Bradyrhizobium valentinum]KRQ99313.1 hypothetical protein CP49_12010 [Bradyrhizobium valentinum]